MKLQSLLLALGGEFLVAPPKPDPDVRTLLEQGLLTDGPVKLELMKSSSCHQNVAAVWKAQAHGIAVRVKYFGILLQGKRADNFAETKVLSRLCNSLAVLPYDNFVGPWWERTEAAAILLRDFSKFL